MRGAPKPVVGDSGRLVTWRHIVNDSAGAKTLDALGRRYGTDKASDGHNYLAAYEEFLFPYRDKAEIVMEIGVRDGPSVRVWQDYFPNARIVGVDIMEKCRVHAKDRIVVEIGDQSNPKFLHSLISKYKADIIIDDGSHIWNHQINTFRTLFPHLKPGGLFICEDLHTSKINSLAKYGRPHTETAAGYFGKLAAQVGAQGPIYGTRADPELTGFQKQIEWFRFGPQFAAIKKICT